MYWRINFQRELIFQMRKLRVTQVSTLARTVGGCQRAGPGSQPGPSWTLSAALLPTLPPTPVQLTTPPHPPPRNSQPLTLCPTLTYMSPGTNSFNFPLSYKRTFFLQDSPHTQGGQP